MAHILTPACLQLYKNTDRSVSRLKWIKDPEDLGYQSLCRLIDGLIYLLCLPISTKLKHRGKQLDCLILVFALPVQITFHFNLQLIAFSCPF